MSEPCMCGDPACYLCFGPQAKFYGWCDECEHADECDPSAVIPGSKDCQRKTDNDNAEEAAL
jgi:hypothetical protein